VRKRKSERERKRELSRGGRVSLSEKVRERERKSSRRQRRQKERLCLLCLLCLERALSFSLSHFF